ncbi:unnamed protein product, partial [Didymodactylos carnosus]
MCMSNNYHVTNEHRKRHSCRHEHNNVTNYDGSAQNSKQTPSPKRCVTKSKRIHGKRRQMRREKSIVHELQYFKRKKQLKQQQQKHSLQNDETEEAMAIKQKMEVQQQQTNYEVHNAVTAEMIEIQPRDNIRDNHYTTSPTSITSIPSPVGLKAKQHDVKIEYPSSACSRSISKVSLNNNNVLCLLINSVFDDDGTQIIENARQSLVQCGLMINNAQILNIGELIDIVKTFVKDDQMKNSREQATMTE